jgi:hypothetical protein
MLTVSRRYQYYIPSGEDPPFDFLPSYFRVHSSLTQSAAILPSEPIHNADLKYYFLMFLVRRRQEFYIALEQKRKEEGAL